MANDRNCANCRHGAAKEVGYSDYTVEGTVFICMEGKNTGMLNGGVSYESYEDHNKPPYTWAACCDSYRPGKPGKYSVDESTPGWPTPKSWY